jgi:hypothetical protein
MGIGGVRAAGVAVMVAAAMAAAGCSATSPTPPPAPPAAPPASASAPPASAAPTTADPTTAPAGTASGAPADPARCTTAELTGSLVGGEGAAGTVHRTLVLTNTGARACELRGFPGVSYVAGEDGHQVGPAAEMVGERGAQVRLAVGDSAGTDVGLVQVGNFDPALCRPEPVRGLRVYPPGDTASLFVPADGTGCAGTPPGPQLTVATLAAR